MSEFNVPTPEEFDDEINELRAESQSAFDLVGKLMRARAEYLKTKSDDKADYILKQRELSVIRGLATHHQEHFVDIAQDLGWPLSYLTQMVDTGITSQELLAKFHILEFTEPHNFAYYERAVNGVTTRFEYSLTPDGYGMFVENTRSTAGKAGVADSAELVNMSHPANPDEVHAFKQFIDLVAPSLEGIYFDIPEGK